MLIGNEKDKFVEIHIYFNISKYTITITKVEFIINIGQEGLKRLKYERITCNASHIIMWKSKEYFLPKSNLMSLFNCPKTFNIVFDHFFITSIENSDDEIVKMVDKLKKAQFEGNYLLKDYDIEEISSIYDKQKLESGMVTEIEEYYGNLVFVTDFQKVKNETPKRDLQHKELIPLNRYFETAPHRNGRFSGFFMVLTIFGIVTLIFISMYKRRRNPFHWGQIYNTVNIF
ncbi:hypothetical protein RF11_16475 [Thelohanellus kitauei]|uniref:Uncharacterized protein n=1 Tax=Thelohanellus kitauei TaxID=669202 RepID=A0A0C2J776_THEKT|nr:hypothetical protein RF11_16475 [Thelohanellus kitauei]